MEERTGVTSSHSVTRDFEHQLLALFGPNFFSPGGRRHHAGVEHLNSRGRSGGVRLIIIFSSAAASHCLSKRAGRCAAILLRARWPRGVLLTLSLLVYLRPEEHVPLVTSSPNEPPKQPNLLLAMADQLRWDAVGYAWQSNRPNAVRTPNLDRLASESVSFAYAVSSTPTCTPARAALLTGRRPWGHGLLGYGEIATRYPMAFPRVLRDAGVPDRCHRQGPLRLERDVGFGHISWLRDHLDLRWTGQVQSKCVARMGRRVR